MTVQRYLKNVYDINSLEELEERMVESNPHLDRKEMVKHARELWPLPWEGGSFLRVHLRAMLSPMPEEA